MKKIKIFFSTILIGVLTFTTLLTSSYAATGNQGYAIYRDGAVIGLTYHAGIMDKPYSTDTNPVVHARGSSYQVQIDTWAHFMETGNTFKGYYRPKTAPTSTVRDQFVAMGRNLATEAIPYTALYQIYYDLATAGQYVDASDITYMRCDGLVEYIYEWYFYRVYGNDTYWDITLNSSSGRDHHSGSAITPSSQATSYLTKLP